MARGVTTQWEDMQVKMGNWAPVEKEPDNYTQFYTEQEKLEYYDPKKMMSAAQLQEKAEDDIDFDDDDEFYAQYKAERLKVLQQKAELPRFGTLLDVNKQEWEAEITNAQKDVWVVIHMYQDQ